MLFAAFRPQEIKKVTASERSRRNLGGVIFTHAARSFSTPKPDNRICCDTQLMVTGTSFHAPANRANRLAECQPLGGTPLYDIP
jgi:hypothetical protein